MVRSETCSGTSVNVNALSNVSDTYLQTLLSVKGKNDGTRTNQSSLTLPQDANPQLSPLAQVMSKLQQLQQQNPAEYQKVTQDIATNLQKAAQTAQADGNIPEADKLNQLAAPFQSASTTGQPLNMKDVAQAVGHHHHHHHGAPPPNGADADSSAAGISTGSNQSPSPAGSVFAANSTQSDSLNPVAIMLNSLSMESMSTLNS